MKHKVMTKSKSESLLVDSLFKSPKTLRKTKYCGGKYQWLGSQKAHIAASSAELNESSSDYDDIKAIYFERQTDEDGPFCRIMCVSQ